MPGPFQPRPVRKGDGISAGQQNAMQDELARLGRFTGSGVEGRSGPGGLSLAVPRQDGLYAFLPIGGTITAAVGMTLGYGDVVLCTRDGAACTADGHTQRCYNAGGLIDGGTSGVLLAVDWRDGELSTSVAPCP